MKIEITERESTRVLEFGWDAASSGGNDPLHPVSVIHAEMTYEGKKYDNVIIFDLPCENRYELFLRELTVSIPRTINKINENKDNVQ